MAIYCECGCGTELPVARYQSQQSRFVRNHHRPRRGRTHTAETRRKISEAKLKSNPGYSAIHVWMLTHYEKAGECVECGKRGKTDWANISGEYHRDRADFRELCRSCHRLEHNRAKG
jgi:hypothetical protein